jgi:hypothetical protein
MSEKIYALLLRLFPSHFRKDYGEDALQLFRDRARDEKGFTPRLRLWFDLLADLVISVPREYFYAEPELVASSGQRLSSGPSFYFMRDERPRPGALALGAVFSLMALATFSTLLSQGGVHKPRNASARQLRQSAPARQVAGDKNSAATGGDATLGSASFDQGDSGDAMPAAPNEASTAAPAPVGQGNVDAAERQRVLNAAIANLKQHYVYPDKAQKMAETLLANAKRGEYDAIADGDTFAHQLTKQMRDVSHDTHLELVYSQNPLPPQPAEQQTPEELARYREEMKRMNCAFEKVETLPHNIGYLKLNFFPDRSVCEQTATAAMASLNHADALIVDLRDNRGGMPNMVALMASYFFDHPEYFYNPRDNTTQQSWTHSPIPGNMLADKPVYVLTSSRTFSGAEQFCYNLKMLKRATLVGEATGGAAHAGVWYRIDDHFGMGIPETKPINPYATPDWAGTGVEPDVKVRASDALETAVKLAQGKLQKK